MARPGFSRAGHFYLQILMPAIKQTAIGAAVSRARFFIPAV